MFFPPGTNLDILTTLCWMLSEGRLGGLLQEHWLVLTSYIGIYRPIKHFIHSVTDWRPTFSRRSLTPSTR